MTLQSDTSKAQLISEQTAFADLVARKTKIDLPKLKIHAITRQLPATADRLNQFCTETAQDEELVLLKHIVQTGWPQDICDLPKEM